MTATSAHPALRTVAELARAGGVGPETVRYYEREGLLPAIRRTSAGYRQFDEEALDRLAFIRGAQALGLRLDDIRDLLAVRDAGVCPCEPAAERLTRRLAELDDELARLTVLRRQMAEMVRAVRASSAGEECPPPTPGSWCPAVTSTPRGWSRCPTAAPAAAAIGLSSRWGRRR